MFYLSCCATLIYILNEIKIKKIKSERSHIPSFVGLKTAKSCCSVREKQWSNVSLVLIWTDTLGPGNCSLCCFDNGVNGMGQDHQSAMGHSQEKFILLVPGHSGASVISSNMLNGRMSITVQYMICTIISLCIGPYIPHMYTICVSSCYICLSFTLFFVIGNLCSSGQQIPPYNSNVCRKTVFGTCT